MFVLKYIVVLTAFFLTKTSAFVFPDLSSDTSQWETVEQYRERHNITYYQPVHIHPEYCRYVTEDTCRANDEAAARSIEKRQQRRLNPSKGSFTVLVLLVQFTDHQDRVLPPKEYYEELCNGSGPSATNPVGSISEYFDQSSYGQFNINCEVMDWRLTNNTEDYFAQGMSGLVGSDRGQDFFRPILDEIEAAAPDPFYFFGLDGQTGDNDGQIEIVVLHSGYAAEGIATDCYGRGRDDRIWSQGHKGTDNGWRTSDKNFEVTGYTVASALDPKDDCAGNGAKMGVSCLLVAL
jgi:hypothetical protein